MVDRIGVDYFGHVVSASLSIHATEEVLIHVGPLGHLRELYLMGLEVTDEGLAQPQGSGRPENLDLTGAKVNNDGLMSLEGLTKLEVLNLAHADRVGDAGLVHLRGLTGLRTLALYNTGVTVAGVWLAATGPAGGRRSSIELLTDAGTAEIVKVPPGVNFYP